MRDGETLTMTTRDLPGVQITLPEEDFDTLIQVLTAHYEPMSNNVAVIDAWHKYRMLIAMTRR